MNTPIRTVFQGRVLTLNLERVTLPNGAVAELEIAHHPGGAAVVALDRTGRVCLLRQFRHATGRWILELPAGKIDNREPPLDCAQRELVEEAGVAAARWDGLGAFFSSPGVLTEVIHVFLARELSAAQSQPEAHEVFEVHWVAMPEALAMAVDGRIEDGKTLVGLFRAGAALTAGAQVPVEYGKSR
jgi:ADP-ribose pyrophosphatase